MGNKYTTYNIDLNTGKEINFLEICNTLKLDSTELYNNVCEQMEKVLKEEYTEYYDYPNDEKIVQEYNDYVKENKEIISNSLFVVSTKFFIDDSGKLNVICKISHNAGKGSMECILPVQ